MIDLKDLTLSEISLRRVTNSMSLFSVKFVRTNQTILVHITNILHVYLKVKLNCDTVIFIHAILKGFFLSIKNFHWRLQAKL